MTVVNATLLPAQPAPPRPAEPLNASRIAGWTLLGIWLSGGLFLVWWLVTDWDPEKIARFGPRYLEGLQVTVTLVVVSILIGSVLSVPVALGRMSKNPVIARIAFAYVYFFRGTPLIAQLFLIYYGLGSFKPQLEAIGLWVFFRDAWNCAVFSFALNTAAYQAEIVRGAVESVHKGQWEGASSLGLTRFQAFRLVIVPQALIVALRPYGNEIILMVKASAIVALVTVFDLMGETRRAYSRTYDFQAYIWAAFFYLAIVELIRNVWNWLEARLTRHLKR